MHTYMYIHVYIYIYIYVSILLHLTNEELYKNIPKISDTIRKQRLRFARHCWRTPLRGVHIASAGELRR